MKKKRIVAAILALILIFSLCATAFAEEIMPLANAYINSKTGSISRHGDGTIDIYFYVCATGKMSSLGASKIELYKADGSLMKTFYSSSYSNMLTSNDYAYGSSVSYSGKEGESYYAVITFYASCDDGSSTATYTTSVTKA